MRFEFLNGPQDGMTIEVDEARFGIGRGGNNRITMPYGRYVTSHHGEVRQAGAAVFFTDTGNRGKGSTNGTSLRREGKESRLPAMEEKELKPGDILVLGDCIWLKYIG